MKRWYALFCKPREDARAQLHLENQGYTVFRPLARVRKIGVAPAKCVVESMFPRYMFVHLDAQDENWAPIRSTRGVVGLVRWGEYVPSLPNAWVSNLQARLSAEGWLDLSQPPAWQPQQPVRIVAGAFEGSEAIFQSRSGKDRVLILLNMLGQMRQVEVRESQLSQLVIA